MVGSNTTCSVRDCPGFSVAGNVAPLAVKPAPVRAAEFTVTAAVPEEVKVSVLVEEVLIVTLPNARLVALTVNCGTAAATPVPLKAMDAVLPEAELDEIARLPVYADAAVGSKATCNVTDCPGFNVAGNVGPVTKKPAPESAAEFTVTGAVPDEVSVTVFVEAVLIVTLPKDKLVALTVNCGTAAATPVPLNPTEIEPVLYESVVMARLPV